MNNANRSAQEQAQLKHQQKYNDGYNIPLCFDNPNVQFSHYCGVLNLLDRDVWNNQLNDRNFLLNLPPWINMVYPQSTNQCIPADCYKLLENPDLDRRSLNYWYQENRGFDPCNNTGIPTNCNQGIGSKFTANQCPRNPSDCLPNLPETIPNAQCNNKFRPWINGIKYNIDVESKLFSLGFYNNQDYIPNNLSNLNQVPCSMDEYFPPLCIDTPKVIDNTTKISFNYPTHLNYNEYNRFLLEANKCCDKYQCKPFPEPKKVEKPCMALRFLPEKTQETFCKEPLPYTPSYPCDNPLN